MSKAIAVLDEMPEGCSSCPFSIKYGQVMLCVKLRREVDELPYDYRPEWCFLKPMPEPFIPEPAYYTDEESFQVGYNAALDDVEGKNDE